MPHYLLTRYVDKLLSILANEFPCILLSYSIPSRLLEVLLLFLHTQTLIALPSCTRFLPTGAAATATSSTTVTFSPQSVPAVIAVLEENKCLNVMECQNSRTCFTSQVVRLPFLVGTGELCRNCVNSMCREHGVFFFCLLFLNKHSFKSTTFIF